ncbi:MAG: hypothetical protein AAF230_06230 [Pseudomonadota bacterium]
MQIFSAERYQPDAGYTFNNNPSYESSQRVLASLVGLVAIGMPAAMLIFGHSDGCVRFSISHHYYTRFLGTIFVGSLTFIAGFLIAYRGTHPQENLYATIAGIGAFLVAIFPTDGTGCPPGEIQSRLFATVLSPEPSAPQPPLDGAFFELFGFAQIIHFGAAAVVFLFLAWYCIVIFTRPVPGVSADQATGELSKVKKQRNTIYYVCGAIILISIAAMALFARSDWWNPARGTLIAETAALWAFGVSWIVKGRLFGFAFNDTA